MTKSRKSMDVDQSDESNGNAQLSNIDPVPVPAGSSGVGLPYAPDGWPHPGDRWTWKVGSRKTASGGHWVDRYISPPGYFPKISGCKARFQSKLTLELYIRKEFPDADVDAFFASFSWRVPAECTTNRDKRTEKVHYLDNYTGSVEAKICSSSKFTNSGGCKAGNETCIRVKDNNYHLKFKACDICCSEAGFCRDCCCILCCGSVDSAHGGLKFIRCQAIMEDDLTCGHVAHLDCALRAYMAGTVGGSIDLDVEYYCRRCDNKTDLIPHVIKIIETCESLDSRDDIEKILNLGSFILCGSEKVRAKKLHNCIGSVMSKLNRGINLTEIWKADNGISKVSTVDAPLSEKEIINLGSLDDSINSNTPFESTFDIEHSLLNGTSDGERQRTLYITSDHADVSAKLEDKIDQALHRLKKSQEFEYKIAEEKLYAQKDFLLGLYQQLEVERSELARPTPVANGGNSDALLTSVLTIVDQIKHEERKFKQMMRIANGFACTPGTILREHFGIQLDD